VTTQHGFILENNVTKLKLRLKTENPREKKIALEKLNMLKFSHATKKLAI